MGFRCHRRGVGGAINLGNDRSNGGSGESLEWGLRGAFQSHGYESRLAVAPIFTVSG